MSSNIITRVRYKKDNNFQKLVGGWCKYVSKDGADGKSINDLDNMDKLYEKEFGIFDTTDENDEYYIWDKNGDINKQRILKDIPKDKSGRMWTLVVSFPPDFAKESGLLTKQDYYLMTKSIMPKFLVNNDLDLTNTMWYASLHKDTDNPHLHICIFEKEEKRKKDTLEKNTLKYLKSNIASYLIDNTTFYQEQDYLFLGLENKIRKNNLTKVEKELFFSNKFRRTLNKDLLNLYDKLPKKGRLQYNAKSLNFCRKDIDKIIDKILYHDTIKYEFEKYYHYLESIEREQKKVYGDSKNNKYIQNKMKRLYSKIGNDILQNYKVYNSKDFLEHHKEFLEVNISNMNFRSRNIKKKSTILKNATGLYKLCKLANLSENETKKVFKKWIKNSNIGYDVDLVLEAIDKNNTDMNYSDFYKTLSNLGYTKERYNNYKSKSFYKHLGFKKFIKKANDFLYYENLKEEKFLEELIEKQLQQKDI